MAEQQTLNINPNMNLSSRRVNLVQEVVTRIQSEILDECHAAGSKLPSEGQLCQAFGVSRTVMREVMRTLTERGLIEVAQGQVARVREPDPLIVMDSFNTFLKRSDYSPLLLLEVRCPLETEAAALAAERATPEQIAGLRKCLVPLRTATTIKAQIANDVQFHECLVEASGNPLFLILQRALTKLIIEWLTKGIEYTGIDHTYDFHTPIVDAIERRDAETARRCMIEHFRDAADKARKII